MFVMLSVSISCGQCFYTNVHPYYLPLRQNKGKMENIKKLRIPRMFTTGRTRNIIIVSKFSLLVVNIEKNPLAVVLKVKRVCVCQGILDERIKASSCVHLGTIFRKGSFHLIL